MIMKLYTEYIFLKYGIYHASKIYLLYLVSKIVNVIFNPISIDILGKLYIKTLDDETRLIL